MRSVFASLVLVTLAAGCDAYDADRPLDFGDPYSLDVGDARPALYVGGGRISVPVAYSGGCAEHAFALRSNVSGGDATVWFVHDDGGDTCEAYIGELLDAALPAAVDAAERITLRAPVQFEGDEETTVRLR